MNSKNIIVLMVTLLFSVILFSCGKQEIHNQATKEDKQKSIELVKLKAEKKKKAQEETEEKIRQNIRDYLKSSGLSGVVTVVKGSDTIFNEGVGYADLDKKTLNGPETTFPIGSITKIFVSTSIMQLQEQGKLNIQDPVSKYLPGFPNGQNIKLYNFLTHTSGINRFHWHRGDTTPLKLVQEIERQPEKFPPGTKWDYLDANYMVLGYIIEKITGMNLHDYIKMNILDKVQMKESGFITSEHPVPYSSIGYIKNADKTVPTKYLSVYPLFACGDIYMTALNLSQFDQALMNGKLISTDSLQQILTPSGLSTYGLGLYKNKEGMAYSVGVLGGWYTIHAYYPDKTSIVILLNVRTKTNIELALSEIRQIVQANNQEQNQKT